MVSHRIRCAASVGLIGLLTAALPAAEPDWRPQLNALVQPLVETETIVCLAVGVVRDGRTATGFYGKLAGADADRPPDGQTLFEIGSVSKVFTGILLADAVGRGRVKLDDPIAALLPAEVRPPTRDDRPITLADLATHFSGLPRLPDNMLPIMAKNPANPYADYTAERLYEFLAKHRPATAPGKNFAYSNLGVGLLGHLLARQANATYEDLLRERVCKPLRLGDTRIALDDDLRRRLAPPHDADATPATNWDIPTFAGAGAIRSTLDDMLRFAATNLDPPAGLLGDAIRLAQQPRRSIAGEKEKIGLGWMIKTEPGVWWHNGQTGGYHSFVACQPSRRLAVVVLANTATGAVDALGWRVLKLAVGEKAEPIAVRRFVAAKPETLERYVGHYEGVPGLEFHVTRDGPRLYVQLPAQPRLRVFPETESDFFYRAVDARITFEVGDDGKCRKLVLHQHGLNLPAWRGGLLGELGKRALAPTKPAGSEGPKQP